MLITDFAISVSFHNVPIKRVERLQINTAFDRIRTLNFMRRNKGH